MYVDMKKGNLHEGYCVYRHKDYYCVCRHEKKETYTKIIVSIDIEIIIPLLLVESSSQGMDGKINKRMERFPSSHQQSPARCACSVHRAVLAVRHRASVMDRDAMHFPHRILSQVHPHSAHHFLRCPRRQKAVTRVTKADSDLSRQGSPQCAYGVCYACYGYHHWLFPH